MQAGGVKRRVSEATPRVAVCISLRLPEHERLREAAERTEKSMSWIVKQALERFLGELEAAA
jgi:predicted DNA-binding protein